MQQKPNSKARSQMDDISVVVQGPFYPHTNDVLKSYCEIDEIKKVIFSGWKDDIRPNFGHNKLQCVFSDNIANKGPGNRNCQIHTSLAGLQNIKTEFAIKVRSDLYFHNIGDVICLMLYKKSQLITQNDYATKKIISSGPDKKYPFFSMDFIMSGATADLIDMFDIPHDVSTNPHQDLYSDIVSETYIQANYCAKRDTISAMMLENWKDYLTLGSKFKNRAVAHYAEIYPKLYYCMPHVFTLPKYNAYNHTHYLSC